ncbi:MAG: hypothetical protein Q8O67_01385 [Deltaproteobacteria bacterium]|nr:hypothetical protein [Deltaproteobacteria bacterium]
MRLALLLLFSLPAVALDPKGAAADEEQAFAAIDKEQWCQAARLFERAHSQGPAVDLLMNAAQAAEYGGDFAGALRFVGDVKLLPAIDAAKKKTANARATELSKLVAKKGPGVPCPPLPPPVAPEPTPAPTPEPTTTTTLPAEEPADLRPVGFAAAGIGGAVVLIGASVSTVGLLPWFAHGAASSEILVAERSKADATALQEKQAEAREGWESYGQALTMAGGVVAGLGVVAIAGGLGLGLLGEAPAGASE